MLPIQDSVLLGNYPLMTCGTSFTAILTTGKIRYSGVIGNASFDTFTEVLTPNVEFLMITALGNKFLAITGK